MKCGLVLEGGARRGMFTAGVLDCFLENKIEFPYVVGASMGANAALDYVAGQEGRTRDVMMGYAGKIPMSMQFRSFMLAYFRRMVYEYPYKQYPFNFKAFFESDKVCELVATDVELGEAVYFSEKQDEKRLLDYLAASCSVPIVFPTMDIYGRKYMDGSIADAIAYDRAFSQGCDKVVVVLTKAPYALATDYSKLRSLCYRMYGKNYPAFFGMLMNRIDRYKQQRDKLTELEKEGKALVFQPRRILVHSYDTRGESLNIAYRAGYLSAKARLDKVKEFMSK